MTRRIPGGRALLSLTLLLLVTLGLLGTLATTASAAPLTRTTHSRLALVAATAGTASDGENLVKVFVVPGLDRTGGQPVGLAQVAAATLGDQNRAGEIFQLNQGQRQPDGDALQNANQQLTPGWILRLPDDATGQLVQLARERADQAVEMDNGQTQGGNDTGLPTAAVLAAAGSVLLALITTAIVARRRVARWFSGLGRALDRLREPGRRRRRLAGRRSLGDSFRSDTETVRRAYGTLGTLQAVPAPPGGHPQVHALEVDHAGVTVWISADTVEPVLPAPWQNLESTRWRMNGPGRPDAPGAHGTSDGSACLVRVGRSDSDGMTDAVLVDLSRLDGVLSVTGDPEVSRDVVRHLLAEVAAVAPGTPVQVIGAHPALPVPAGLNQVSGPPARTPAPRENSPVRATAVRRPVRGLVVVAGTPDRATLDELFRLCGSDAAGWTGLVAGDVATGAHWRWHARADGDVRIPVLDLDVTVPA
ncbi:hypothetical protein [Kineosporia sp. NBRC 101731]|uniref:hypothetical protein n=1 Tax=Kineosporia sp. NBRC 101731 TaxID=3032199 RepID=UPI0024A062F6|nr:hypothetical protein [Kineosporia sp. NBRC 101731]GLY29422.1 hypothetical protein Kisp02_27870 [Kineosporia sp. NBRC 101731]